MPIQRITVGSSVDIETDRNVAEKLTGSVNVIYDRYADETTYATQRPSITMTATANTQSLPPIGRGIYYWNDAASFYIVDNDTISAGAGFPIGTISAGRNKVYISELNGKLVFIDPENNEGWYIDKIAPTTVLPIDDVDFPPNQEPPLQLAGGVVTLDNFLFVLDSGGTIWHSDFGDATSWNALNFITAEREPDNGIYIAKHHDHVVILGSKTIEFFYNAANPSGSVLSRRQDVSYRTGAMESIAVDVAGDRIAFIGTEQSGTLGLYEIKGFKLNKKTNFTMDSSISSIGLRRDGDFILASAMVNDHKLIFVTPVFEGQDGQGNNLWEYNQTIVFDGSTGLWTQFVTNLNDIDSFPVLGIADKVQGKNRAMTMLFLSGEIVELTNTLEPTDSFGSGDYFDIEDYLENQADYIFTISNDTVEDIEMILTLGDEDFDSLTNKFAHSLWLVGSVIAGALRTEPIKVSWSDNHLETFSSERDIDVDMRRRLSRLGKFRRRMHRIRYKGPDTLRIEALEIDLGVSAYA